MEKYGYHVSKISPEMAESIKEKGLLTREKVQEILGDNPKFNIPENYPIEDLKKINEIFDQVKPDSIPFSRKDCVFLEEETVDLLKAKDAFFGKEKGRFIKVKLTGNEYVADLKIIDEALNLAKRLKGPVQTPLGKFFGWEPEPQISEQEFTNQNMELAKNYWGGCLKIDNLYEYYEKEDSGVWTKKQDTPNELPKHIQWPEILVPTGVEKEYIEIVEM
ncbi:hypothetical protein L6249_03400 [Candidatus Parcubacteria bacterium]|nr:hypothetical protein [Candidatus Parcubacteria bacterium]